MLTAATVQPRIGLTVSSSSSSSWNHKGSSPFPAKGSRTFVLFARESSNALQRLIVRQQSHHPRHRPPVSRAPMMRVEAFNNVATQQSQEHIDDVRSTADKALDINVRTNAYGSVAEIGAGQEVARWLFRVGGAAGTVARSISAYDKLVSDKIYGQTKRFVTDERLESMLDVEYDTCVDALEEARGDSSRFFSFADTVTAKAFGRDNDCHGWMGIKIQLLPRTEPIKVLMHCRMKDTTFQAQQEAIGVLGINFMYGAVNWDGDVEKFLKGLMDNLSLDRIEVDAVQFQGSAVESVDQRSVALRLVQYGLANAVLFNSSGAPKIVQDALYKKDVMLLRGRFRPFTNLHNDMLITATEQYLEDSGKSGCEADWEEALGENTTHPVVVAGTFDECVRRDGTMVILEMSIHDFNQCPIGDKRCVEDVEHGFVNRMEALATMGYNVMVLSYAEPQEELIGAAAPQVTSHKRHFCITQHLRHYTKGDINYIMGLPELRGLLKEENYEDLEGGILESFGRLFKSGTQVYVYPTVEKNGDIVVADKNLVVEPEVQKLYDFLVEKGLIRSIREPNMRTVTAGDHDTMVDDLILRGDDDWEIYVPKHVAIQIKSKKLVGFDKSFDGNYRP